MRRSLTRSAAAAAVLALVASLFGPAPASANENRPPDRPDTASLTARGEACSTDRTNPTLLNSTQLTLAGVFSDPDPAATGVSQQVKAEFEWGPEDSGEPWGRAESAYTTQSPGAAPPSRSVTARDLPEKTLIGYRARAHDTRTAGEWSAYCWIEISTAEPASPPSVTSEDYPNDNRFHGAPGKPGAFTFDGNGVDTAVAYDYGLQGACETRVEPETPGGPVTVSITPSRSGPNLLHARSVDAYGNSSGCGLVHTFGVAPPADPVAHFPLDEGEGDASADAMVDDRVATAVGGIDWTRGRAGVHEGGTEYRLAGTAVSTANGALRTEAPVVDTDGTFTVSAWLRLDDTGDDAVALSQDGEAVSGFRLGYDADEKAWYFDAPTADDPAAAHTRVSSTAPVRTGAWTQLIGVHDADTGELGLYVDGSHQGAAEHDGAWNAEGAFVIGGGHGPQGPGWPGAVDHVLVWDRLLYTEDTTTTFSGRSEVWEAATRPVVPEGVWHLNETGGTVAADASDHGLDATLHGDPAEVWNGERNPVTRDPSARLDGTAHLSTEGPAVRTDNGFSASAWVRLDDADRDAVFLSQSGEDTDGFALGYDSSTGRWFFETAVEDAPGAETHRAASRSSARTGRWVHVAGTYDHIDGTLTLYVDGVSQEAVGREGSWNADGGVLIGAGTAGTAAERHWTGGIAVVQVHQGVALEDDVNLISMGFPPV
ncbi:LamG-like jellyroll fold domain-containing protein [Nocardiopsis flavescens]|uniref:LamG domain-containing protein n=2 Tax=Nocardiopsis flavescens TaxID=758803 RepID=UPI0036591EC1